MQPLSSYITISFKDGSLDILLEEADAKKVELIAMSLFHGMQEQTKRTFLCSQCSATYFKYALAIVGEGKNFEDVLSRKHQKNVNTYEKLAATITYLYPSQIKEMNRKLLEYFSLLSLQEAASFIEEGQNTLPFRYEIAQKMVLQALYFADPAQAVTYFDQVKDCQKAYLKAQIENNVVKMKSLKKRIYAYGQELKALKKSPEGFANASRSTYGLNPFILQKSLQAGELLEVYCQKIKKALAKNGADMTRQDLLEHIIGPANYLLSYYGIVPNEKESFIPQGAEPISIRQIGNCQFPEYAVIDWKYKEDTKFCHSPLVMNTCQYRKNPLVPAAIDQLDYLLNNSSPYDLEEQIRTDLTKHSKHHFSLKLPERLIKDKPLS